MNGNQTSGEKNSKIWVCHVCLDTLYWKFCKMLFHLLLEVEENSKLTVWLNGIKKRT